MAIIPFISRKPLDYQTTWLKRFEQLLPDETVLLTKDIPEQQRADCELAIVLDPDPKQVASFTNLKWIQSLWAGVESLIDLAKQQNIQLVRMIDPKLADTMAEAVLAWTLYIHRQMPSYAAQQQNKTWRQLSYQPAEKCNVGILGLGELGVSSANRLISNGFNLLGWSRTKKTIEGIQCFNSNSGLDEMASQSNILICLLPLTQETEGIIDKALLQRLPSKASLINFARGQHLVEQDLLDVLDTEHLYHAVLDVYHQEPLAKNSPIWSHPKITALPHIAATSYPQTAAEIAADNIRYFRQTGQLKSVVDLTRGY
jgi:glyoxylate/hydroxypyruvate reductase